MYESAAPRKVIPMNRREATTDRRQIVRWRVVSGCSIEHREWYPGIEGKDGVHCHSSSGWG